MDDLENPKIKYIFMELTNMCNFNCIFCPNDIMKRPKGMMNLRSAIKLIDEIANDNKKNSFTRPDLFLELHVMGEPLLHPDVFHIIKYAEEKGKKMDGNEKSINLINYKNNIINFKICVKKTWSPALIFGSSDKRELGIQMKRLRFN